MTTTVTIIPLPHRVVRSENQRCTHRLGPCGPATFGCLRPLSGCKYPNVAGVKMRQIYFP